MELRSRRHRRTLGRVLERPTPADIRWADIESLLRGLGIEIVERSGSRVQLRRGSINTVVHKPHPQPETGRETVRDIAVFLNRIGVSQ